MEYRIHVRVSQEQKGALTKAAEAKGKTLTSFMVEAALKEAGHPVQEPAADEAVFSGLPSFLATSLHAAKRGGVGGYRDAGWHFAIHVRDMDPLSDSGRDWLDLLDSEFRPIVEDISSDEGTSANLEAVKDLMGWMRKHCPKIAKQIPTRRWDQFALGIFHAHEQGRLF